MTISLVGAVYYLGQSRYDISIRIEGLLQAVHPAASVAVFHLDSELSLSVVEGLIELPIIASASIRDETKAIVAEDQKELAERWYSGVAVWAYGEITDYGVRLSYSDYPRDIGRLDVRIDINYLTALYLRQILIFLITALLISSLLAIVLGVIFYRLLTRPLMQISEAVLTAIPGGGDAFTQVQDIALQKDELGQLVVALTSQFQRFEDVLTERTELASQLQVRDASIVAMNSAFFITDARQPDHPIIDVNPAFETVTGYARDEILGKNLNFLHGKDTAKDEIAAVQNAFTQGISYDSKLIHYKKDGGQFWSELYIDTVTDEAGNILYSVGIMQDITEWRNAEELWRRSQKMDAIGKMAGGIAHDFNNLLAIMLGHLEMLIEQFGDQQYLKGKLELISRSGQRAAALTGRLLRFSRTEVGAVSVTSVNKLVEGMSEMLQRSLTPEIKIEYELKSSPDTALINPGDLEDAILNLSINARDAISGPGTITIASCSKILHEGDAELGNKLSPGAYIQLSIRDSGCGMNPETLERVFDPFFTTKELVGGTGLGLFQVYGFASRSAGDIQVQSELGGGTTFLLYLPITSHELDSQQLSSAKPELIGGNETIMVVDDERELIHLMQLALGKLGYQIMTADDATAALELFKENRSTIDLVISDVVMPGLNGYELIEKMRHMTPQLRVLFVSGYATDVQPESGTGRPNEHRLAKPYTIAELSGAVRSALDSEVC